MIGAIADLLVAFGWVVTVALACALLVVLVMWTAPRAVIAVKRVREGGGWL